MLALTLVAMAWQAVPWVPRTVVDYSRTPLLRGITQPQTFGSDTIADAYESRVILRDPTDMYVKGRTAQTPLEARTWSKGASSPYPAAALLVDAGIFWLVGESPARFYIFMLGVAATFLTLSYRYFLRTRWYLFPLLYANFGYLAYRFVYVQDDTYLIMLVVVALALFAAVCRPAVSYCLMAFAITLKVSPAYYVTELLRMRRRTAIVFVGILAAGFVLPWFLLPDYLSIYAYGATLKGSSSTRSAAVAAAIPFAAVLWYIEIRRGFDLEERIGWGLVPAALFFAIRMNVARHLLMVLLIPDKRGRRNLAVAFALALRALFPATVRLGSVLSILLGLLAVIVVADLSAIGWRTVRADLRHPLRTVGGLIRCG